MKWMLCILLSKLCEVSMSYILLINKNQNLGKYWRFHIWIDSAPEEWDHRSFSYSVPAERWSALNVFPRIFALLVTSQYLEI